MYAEDDKSIFDACLSVWEIETGAGYGAPGPGDDPPEMDAEAKREYWAALALKHTHGLGPRTWKRLLTAYGGAYPAVMDARNWRARGLAGEDKARTFSSEAWRTPARVEWDAFHGRNDRVLLWTDPDYPEQLREIPDPPLFLYYLGQRALLRNPGVAIVGPRCCTRAGSSLTRELARNLARAGVTVVSGMAWGVDREAHLAALEEVGSSVAVLGTGLDLIYPGDNADVWRSLLRNGLVVTEYGPGSRPLRGNFPRRNRIISGLSLGVVVAEGAERSGGLITARLAVEHGREVFCAPGDGSEAYAGCRTFLEQGAHPVRSALDVVMELGPLLKGRLTEGATIPPASRRGAGGTPPRGPKAAAPDLQSLPPDQAAVLEVLQSRTQAHPDAIAETLDWPASRVSRTLLALEVRGMVKQLPGMLYRCA